MRKRLSKVLEDKVKREFNYLCAICGKTNPHLHHIDGDAANNSEDNLLPLCPNHHLLDAHSPTSPPDPRKLRLFRRFKDPTILLPQFHPIYRRMRFLIDLGNESFDLGETSAQAAELVDFMGYFQIGGFYRDRLEQLIAWKPAPHVFMIDRGTEHYREEMRTQAADYSQQLHKGREAAIELIIESLRFQAWRAVPPYTDA